MSSVPDAAAEGREADAPVPGGPRARRAVGRLFALRIALWYATLFVAGSIAIVLATYYLTATSLAQRDQQIIRGKLGD